MAHKIAYEISGANYDGMAELKSKGFIDFAQVVHANAGPDVNFVNQCRFLGVTPIFQNGNDGIAGCSGNCDNYYQNIANAGYESAGGESEPPSECAAIMGKLIFSTYGGEYADCGANFSNIWAHGAPPASGHGISACLETYIGVSRVAVCANEIVDACVAAKQNGCFEVGILIGAWIAGHPELGYTSAGPYINMIQRIEQRGVTVGKVGLWWGHGTAMRSNYYANGNNNIMNGLMAVWPPDMRTMKQRKAGGPSPPGPTPPGPTPPPPKPVTIDDLEMFYYD